MNAPKRVRAKLYFDGDVALTEFVPVFHRWIQEKAVPGLLIDVADYKHVPDGPGILLVGHDVEYWVAEENGRFSLQVIVKREWPVDTLAGRLKLTIAHLMKAADVLAVEPSLIVTLDWTSLSLTLLDRLHYPNNEASYTAVLPVISPLLAKRFGEVLKVKRLYEDARQPLGVWVETAVADETVNELVTV